MRSSLQFQHFSLSMTSRGPWGPSCTFHSGRRWQLGVLDLSDFGGALRETPVMSRVSCWIVAGWWWNWILFGYYHSLDWKIGLLNTGKLVSPFFPFGMMIPSDKQKSKVVDAMAGILGMGQSQMVPQFGIAKLVNRTPISLWFMVNILTYLWTGL